MYNKSKSITVVQSKQTNPPLLRNLGGGSFLGNVHDLQHVIVVGSTIVFMPETFGAVTKSSLAQARKGRLSYCGDYALPRK